MGDEPPADASLPEFRLDQQPVDLDGTVITGHNDAEADDGTRSVPVPGSFGRLCGLPRCRFHGPAERIGFRWFGERVAGVFTGSALLHVVSLPFSRRRNAT